MLYHNFKFNRPPIKILLQKKKKKTGADAAISSGALVKEYVYDYLSVTYVPVFCFVFEQLKNYFV